MESLIGFDDLAIEIIAHIFTFIPTSELALVSTVCRRFAQAMWVDLLWMSKCEDDKALTWKSVDVTWRLYTMDLSGLCPHLNRFDRYQLPWILQRLDEKLAQRRDAVRCDGPRCTFAFNNLWMCVEPKCGFVGCGRRDNVHMMAHIAEKKHHVTIKLASMEMYCYSCEAWLGGTQRHAVERSRYEELRQILSRCTGKTFDAALVERRLKERTLPSPRNTHRYWAILAIGWEKKWERFIIGDDDGFSDAIDNAALLDAEGKLRPTLRSNVDYHICSVLAWRYFHARYGGGPTVLWDWFEHKFVVAPAPEALAELMAQTELIDEAEARKEEARKVKKRSLKEDATPERVFYANYEQDDEDEVEEGDEEAEEAGEGEEGNDPMDEGDFDASDDDDTMDFQHLGHGEDQ